MLLVEAVFSMVDRRLCLMDLKSPIHGVDSLNVCVVILHNASFRVLRHRVLHLAFEIVEQCGVDELAEWYDFLLVEQSDEIVAKAPHLTVAGGHQLFLVSYLLKLLVC